MMKLTNYSLLPSSYPDELDQLISVHPLELKFLLKLNKPISTSFQLSNKSDQHFAFRVKTTNVKKYTVRPTKGIVLPRSQTNVTVTMQALKEEPSVLQCKDKFLVQSVAVPYGTTPKDITPEMFNKEAGNHVEECKLSADYDIPTESEESEEETSEIAPAVPIGSSDHQIASTKTNDLITTHTKEKQANDHISTHTKEKQANDLVSTLTKEEQSIIQENNRLLKILVKVAMLTKEVQSINQENIRLQQELESLKKGRKRNNGINGLFIFCVLLIVVLDILLRHNI